MSSMDPLARHLPRIVPHISGHRVLWALVLMFITLPFLEQFAVGQAIEAILLTVVFCGAVFAIGADRRKAAVALGLAIPAVAGKWVQLARPDVVPPQIFLGCAILCLGYVTFQFVRFAMGASRVDADVLCTGLSSFLMLALLWGLAYIFVDELVPGSFALGTAASAGHRLTGFTALYFSTVTLCTVGYGDIVPVSGVARMLAMLEGITGVFFIAVMVARMMSLYSSEHREERP